MNHVLHPREVGVPRRRHAILPALVFPKTFATPVGDIEGWISKNEISFQVRVTVVAEGIAVLDLPLNTPDCKIHLSETPGRVIGFLSID